jgi:hypothetical protein
LRKSLLLLEKMSDPLSSPPVKNSEFISWVLKRLPQTALAILVAVLFGCVSARDSRLAGTWVSDVDATVSYNRSIDPQMDWQKYGRLFGRMKVTYEHESVVSELDGVTERALLRALRRDENSVTLKIYDRINKGDRLLVVHFMDVDMYWISIRDTDHREYFRRVKQVEK